MYTKEIQELKNIIDTSSIYLAKEKGKLEKIEEEIIKYEKDLSDIEAEIDLLEKVNILFQKTSEYARNQAKLQVENLVTKCLQFIFDEDIKFEIDIDESHNRPSAKFYITSILDGKEIRLEPESAKGGGVVDIVSLALRIAFLEINKPKIEGPLILDEPAKHVSDEYIYNVSEFLKKNSELFNRQTIMVTHNDFLASIGAISYRVSNKHGISNLELIDN